uniref:N-acetyltransferase domain-containing protein n=1 Tax=Oryza meridionalis TaxID=40149 RepID=A0A0E0D4C6_9ORYZ
MDQVDVDVQQRKDGSPPAVAVTLRPLGLADADDFMAWASDERVMRFLRRPLCATREQAVAQIRDTVLGHPWFRAICVDDGRRPVGQVSVWPYADEGGHRANLGYALSHGLWGRGIATAAITMVVARVFDELPGLERLEAVTDVENARSQRVLEKARFRKEGVLRRYIVRRSGEVMDAVIYSFLASDRRPSMARREEKRPL